jgi:hypothetical protein
MAVINKLISVSLLLAVLIFLTHPIRIFMRHEIINTIQIPLSFVICLLIVRSHFKWDFINWVERYRPVVRISAVVILATINTFIVVFAR